MRELIAIIIVMALLIIGGIIFKLATYSKKPFRMITIGTGIIILALVLGIVYLLIQA